MGEDKLRIAMISAHSCPVGTLGTKDTGGMSVYIVELARELGKLGHTVDAYTRVHDPADPIVVELGHNARLIHIEAGEMEQIHKLAVYSHLPDFACGLEAYRKENNLEYDIVFSHYWLSAWIGEYLQQWWGVPHVTMFHTLGVVKNSIGIGKTEPELRIATEGELARSSYHIIAPTEREKAELVNQYGVKPERIGIVPCGVNPGLFRPVDKGEARRETGLDNGKIILYVGRIDPLKGIASLIKAFSYLKRSHDATLAIIGGGESSREETTHLKALAEELGIGDRIIFTGTVKQNRMPYYYSAADVCVIPSFYESFGLVALESLSCGTPIVANDVGDLRNIVRQGETGYVIDSNDPSLLAEKIDLLLNRSDNEHVSAATMRDSVMEFAWANIAEALADEFRLVLDNYYIPVA
ncbi:MAG TPA: glycosyltransferase family 1 protein [Dehalococcoidia bacterium]|nr:glycosyltransferase family 1 protein [Dehalococcoidia bacterium]